MVIMDGTKRKQDDLTPDGNTAQQEREKCRKQGDPETVAAPHVSVMNKDDLCLANLDTPVSTKTQREPVSRGLLSGISASGGASGGKVDLVAIHVLLADLALRVTALETQVLKKDTEIFNLRKDNAHLERQFSTIRADSANLTSMQTHSDNDFIDTLRTEFPNASDGLAAAEKNIAKLDVEVGKLKKMESTLKDSVRKWHLEAEHALQYSMRDTIKIFGVPYKQNENTNEIVRRIGVSIGVSINDWDISVSHRTGKFNGSTPRPIVAKFTRRDVKHMFIANRKFARNITTDDDGNPIRIFIDEHLTPMRNKFCRKLRLDNIPHYTWDGKVFIIKPDESKELIDTPADWERLDMMVSLKEELGIFPKM
jgi:hypothetical protein